MGEAIPDKRKQINVSPSPTVQSTAVVAAVAESGSMPATGFAADDDGYAKTISPFLNRYCLKCHGSEVPEADFRLDQLANDFTVRSTAEKWSEVLDRLHGNEMPPKEEMQPSAEDVAAVVEWISSERLRGEQARRDAAIVLRRLNRAEYNNTIRDLTGVDMRPADEFPADAAAGGFDNNGRALTISPLHLELYLKAAQRVIDRAIVTGQERPPAIKWRVELEVGDAEIAQQLRQQIRGQDIYGSGGNVPVRNGMAVLRNEQMWSQTNGRNFAQLWGFEIPRAGIYAVRIRAAGVVPTEAAVRSAGPEIYDRRQRPQETNLDPEQRRASRQRFEKETLAHVRKHFDEDRRYRYGPPRLKLLCNLGSDRILGEFDVDAPEAAPRVYEVRAWMEPGTSGIMIRNVYHVPGHNWNWGLQEEADFPRPELLLDWVELEGPIHEEWPPASHRQILVVSPHQSGNEQDYAREVLTNFMRRAYRRPLRAGEVELKLELFRRARPACASFEEAIKPALIAVLCSPHFLYLAEVPGESMASEGSAVNASQLAARLSYFLWSTMPDEELVRAAGQGELDSPAEIIAQTERLLKDPRSEEFVKNFSGQWLKLRDIGANPPSTALFVEYDDHLEASMRGESEAFFAEILRHDRSVLSFLRSDFVTINERLARFYDIPGVNGDHFRSVPVPAGNPRGGLLTQGAMLTVTSNGTRTSPVWRGIWILERLLGDPPPPPPPNAGDIPPASPGSSLTTVRERLRLHREQAQCARCHNKIDPLGLALENFDASGQWREREAQGNAIEAYSGDPPIDARGQLPGGAEFVGISGLQQELLNRQQQFLRCLVAKLYEYALGRELGYADQELVESGVRHMQENQLTLRSLIHHVVTSKEFQSK